jgi:cyclophilin family peptidyl-prolyl cis-trans isomerase
MPCEAMMPCRGDCNKFQDAGSVHVAGQAPRRFLFREPGGSVECVECKCELLTACDLGDCRQEGANMGKTWYTARGREGGSTAWAQNSAGIGLSSAGRFLFSRKSLACSALISSVLIGSAAVAAGTHAGNQAEVPCDLLAACNNPATCPALSEDPPAMFSVRFKTTAGEFTVTTVTAWAPPYAARFWQLVRVGYMLGAPFYRVDRINSTMAWVVQFGYRGEPAVDKCWDEKRTSNETWSVSRPGNARGTVAFSMNAVAPSSDMVNCTSDLYCAQGFSTNIFINYADNVRLDSPGFSVFGYVEAGGMRVVDKLFAGYGEVSELCQGDENVS